MTMTIMFQSAVILVQDINVSRRFYEGLLEQKVVLDFGPSVELEGGLALWQIDHAFQTIYACAPHNAERPGGQNVELHFEAADVEAVPARLSQAGVEFVHPVREQPWGTRVFRVCDPDGHIVKVGEPMTAVTARLLGQGLPVKAVVERTGMPAKVVEQIAKGNV
jgi:catechol 2,3-dioxygenase-like lactoylglutathione lyase family enzyme